MIETLPRPRCSLFLDLPTRTKLGAQQPPGFLVPVPATQGTRGQACTFPRPRPTHGPWDTPACPNVQHDVVGVPGCNDVHGHGRWLRVRGAVLVGQRLRPGQPPSSRRRRVRCTAGRLRGLRKVLRQQRRHDCDGLREHLQHPHCCEVFVKVAQGLQQRRAGRGVHALVAGATQPLGEVVPASVPQKPALACTTTHPRPANANVIKSMHAAAAARKPTLTPAWPPTPPAPPAGRGDPPDSPTA